MHIRPVHAAQFAYWGGALLALSLLAATPAFAHTPGQDGDEGDATARALLRASAKAHGSPPAAADGTTRIHARMSIELRTPEGDRVQLIAERKFLDHPGASDPLIWTRVKDGDRTTVRAFDGKMPWVQLAGQQVVPLTGSEHETDRAQLQRDIDLTRQLGRLFLLDRLANELRDLQQLPDEEGNGKKAHVIEGIGVETKDDETTRLRIRLWIDSSTKLLLGCRITPEPTEDGAEKKQDSLDICFWSYRDGQGGLKIPEEIKIHRTGNAKPDQVIRLSKLDLAAKLGQEDFKPR